MTDKPPPKRRFWQMHLLTLLLMTLAAGEVLWLNVSVRETFEQSELLYGGRLNLRNMTLAETNGTFATVLTDIPIGDGSSLRMALSHGVASG
jgi:hypothetical protein